MPTPYEDVREVFIREFQESGKPPTVSRLMEYFGGGTRETFVDYRQRLVRETKRGEIPELNAPKLPTSLDGGAVLNLPPALSGLLTRLDSEMVQLRAVAHQELIRCRTELGHQHRVELAAFQAEREEERRESAAAQADLTAALEASHRERDQLVTKLQNLEDEKATWQDRYDRADQECREGHARREELASQLADLQTAHEEAVRRAAAAEAKAIEAERSRAMAEQRAAAAERQLGQAEADRERARIYQEQIDRLIVQVEDLRGGALEMARHCGALEQRLRLADQYPAPQQEMLFKS